MPLTWADSRGPKDSRIYGGWTVVQPGEYDGSVCAAAMQAVATVTVATCSPSSSP